MPPLHTTVTPLVHLCSATVHHSPTTNSQLYHHHTTTSPPLGSLAAGGNAKDIVQQEEFNEKSKEEQDAFMTQESYVLKFMPLYGKDGAKQKIKRLLSESESEHLDKKKTRVPVFILREPGFDISFSSFIYPSGD